LRVTSESRSLVALETTRSSGWRLQALLRADG
jgi:hypothetical protein